jgi:hypothetical protein
MVGRYNDLQDIADEEERDAEEDLMNNKLMLRLNAACDRLNRSAVISESGKNVLSFDEWVRKVDTE